MEITFPQRRKKKGGKKGFRALVKERGRQKREGDHPTGENLEFGTHTKRKKGGRKGKASFHM